MTPLIRVIFNVLIVLSLVGTWTFIVLYTRTWPWWRNEVARYTVTFSGCLGLFMLYYTLRIFIVSWSIQIQVAILLALFTVLTVTIWWQLLLFIRVKREKRKLRSVTKHEHGEVS